MSRYCFEARNSNHNTILGRTLYIPRMSKDGATALAAAYRSFGVESQLVPESNSKTIKLAQQYLLGDECYPQIITLGSFLKVIENEYFNPNKTAFLLPTARGPCRFGQYKQVFEKLLKEKGIEGVMLVSPTSNNGYEGIGDHFNNLSRLAWWAVICSDSLRKLLLQTRPYEKIVGDTDRVHNECLIMLCKILERKDLNMKDKFKMLVCVMTHAKMKFSAIATNYIKDKTLIGVVGEIYCRLDDFANNELIRIVEKHGGEVWLKSIAEWVKYTNFMQKNDLKLQSKKFSKSMFSAILRNKIQIADERKLDAPLQERFKGYEEPTSLEQLEKAAEPYLPYCEALGEMVLNLSGAINMYRKGVDGIIDISPFTCMNGIVCEAIYPRVSEDCDNIPIRIFYFDGTQSDYSSDIESFLEIAEMYKRKKKKIRVYPSHFSI